MTYGYARVSTADQNLDRQLDALRKHGIDKLFCEKMSGTKKSRPELDKMLAELSDGDTGVIESLSRLGRSVKNLSELMEQFNEKNIRLVSMKETIESIRAFFFLSGVVGMFSLCSNIDCFAISLERDVHFQCEHFRSLI